MEVEIWVVGKTSIKDYIYSNRSIKKQGTSRTRSEAKKPNARITRSLKIMDSATMECLLDSYGVWLHKAVNHFRLEVLRSTDWASRAWMKVNASNDVIYRREGRATVLMLLLATALRSEPSIQLHCVVDGLVICKTGHLIVLRLGCWCLFLGS